MNNIYTSAKRLEVLKDRAKRCVCKSCGTRLGLKKIEFGEPEEAHIELFCTVCNKIEFGTEPEIYNIAKSYVEEFAINFYPDLGSTPAVRRMNINSVCEIVSWALQNMGYCNKAGFLVQPVMDDKAFGSCVVLDDESLNKWSEAMNHE